MAFTLPTFNLTVGIWRESTNYTDPPDVSTMGNLAYGRRIQLGESVGLPASVASLIPYYLTQPMTLLLPKLTDVRSGDSASGAKCDLVEVILGSGRIYWVAGVDDIGKGFANEHRAAVVFPYTVQWAVLNAIGTRGAFPARTWPLP